MEMLMSFKAREGNLYKPAKVGLILKVSKCKHPSYPFRPLSKATPLKHMTSLIALATGLSSHVIDSSSCAMSAEEEFAYVGGQVGKQTGRPSNLSYDWDDEHFSY